MDAFPFRIDTPAAWPEPPPAACDVVVIGGGIIGVMSAWFLARRGMRVALCEKGRIAAEQSSRNWGWIRQQGRDPDELPIMVEANRIWRGLEAECGEDLGFRQTGVVYLANDEKAMARMQAWLPHAVACGVDTRAINAEQVAAMMPGCAPRWVGGIHTPSDARAEPWVAVPALARAAARAGVSLHEDCAARTLDVQAGRVGGVMTERGGIRCDQVVLAGGAWSSLFARNHGIDLPQLSVLSTVAATVPLPSVFDGAAADGHFAFRRRNDGGYTLAPGAYHEFHLGPDAFRHFRKYLPQLRQDPYSARLRLRAPPNYPDSWGTRRKWNADEPSPFEAQRVLNPRPSPRAVRRMAEKFGAAFPSIGVPAFHKAWAGMIDSMPDVVPVIDRADTLPGLVIATGMSGHGFGIGPAIGRVVADLVLGRSIGHDLHRFRFSRFSDGSPIRPGPAL